MSIKLLSEKVSYNENPEKLEILILGKTDRWKEALLAAWLLAWIFCGLAVLREYFLATEREMKMMLVIFLIFWIYYVWRIGRVWLYRRGGNELIKVEGGMLSLKRSFFTYGKSSDYYLDNIEKMEAISLSKRSFAYTYENGWWVLGGEKLGFSYQNRMVRFGMQIDDGVRDKLLKLLKKRISNQLKNP